MFINNGTFDFANKIITIDHIYLILSVINAHLMIHGFCKFGNNIHRNKEATVMILVKETKTIINV